MAVKLLAKLKTLSLITTVKLLLFVSNKLICCNIKTGDHDLLCGQSDAQSSSGFLCGWTEDVVEESHEQFQDIIFFHWLLH